MPGRTLATLTVATLLLGLAACQPQQDQAPATAATLPESVVEAGEGPQPSVGAPPPAGGGVPGAAAGTPGAARPEVAPPTTGDRPQ